MISLHFYLYIKIRNFRDARNFPLGACSTNFNQMKQTTPNMMKFCFYFFFLFTRLVFRYCVWCEEKKFHDENLLLYYQCRVCVMPCLHSSHMNDIYFCAVVFYCCDMSLQKGLHDYFFESANRMHFRCTLTFEILFFVIQFKLIFTETNETN